MGREAGVKARAGEEVWLNTGAGKVWVKVADRRVPGRYVSVAIRGKAQFRISTEDRELNSADVYDPARDPFLNGTLKRIDERAAAEPIPDQEPGQALTDDELLALLAKNGMAFQSAVKKLNERNVQRLKALVEADGSLATVAQAGFVRSYVEETYPLGGQTSTGKEILAEQAGPAE